MTPAIPDGYEIASNDSHGARVWDDTCNKWEPVATGYHCRTYLSGGNIYIAPIRLRLGENYRCRNGQETGELTINLGVFKETHEFWSALTKQSYADTGYVMMTPKFKNEWDIVAHIPKEKKMEYQDPAGHIGIDAYKYGEKTVNKPFIPLSEAARIAQLPEVIAEVERQRKEKEIKVGDWFRGSDGIVDRCQKFRGVCDVDIVGLSGWNWSRAQCTKIPGPPEFIAFLEAGVKK
jgi:hypothetical protein